MVIIDMFITDMVITDLVITDLVITDKAITDTVIAVRDTASPTTRRRRGHPLAARDDRFRAGPGRRCCLYRLTSPRRRRRPTVRTCQQTVSPPPLRRVPFRA